MGNVLSLLEARQKDLQELGVVVENIRFQADNDESVSAHVINPALPYKIIIPVAALLPLDQVRLEEEPASLAPGNFPAAVRNYWQDILPVVLSPSRVAALEYWHDTFRNLPEEIRSRLWHLGFVLPADEAQPPLKYQLLKSRTIAINGRPHLMPLLDFVNYDPSGVAFHSSPVEIGISGMAQDEVFVCYNKGDVFHTAANYKFFGASSWAYSIRGISIGMPGFPTLKLNRNYLNRKSIYQKCPVPNLQYQADGSGVLSHALLGYRHDPDLPHELFRLALADSKWAEAASLIFKEITHANRTYYGDLNYLLDKHGIAPEHPLRNGLRKQLEVLAFH